MRHLSYVMEMIRVRQLCCVMIRQFQSIWGSVFPISGESQGHFLHAAELCRFPLQVVKAIV
jgi:hypothetical protein